MMTHFRKRLTDLLAELNEFVATAGAKETKDDDDRNDASGGGKGKVKRSKKRAPSAEAEQQTMFAEVQIESSEAAPPAQQTVAMPEVPEAAAPVCEPVSAESEALALPNQGTVLMDATYAPADVAYPTDLNLLNEAREKLEAIIDTLHEPVIGQYETAYLPRKSAQTVSNCFQATQAGPESDSQSD